MLYLRPRCLVAGGEIRHGWAILCRDDLIEAVGPASEIRRPEGAEMVECGACLATPGLVDMQFNGAFGHHLTDEPERLWDVAAALLRTGVTRFLPTLITCSPESQHRALDVLAAGPPSGWLGAEPVGFHFEGPYLEPRRIGAHDVRLVRAPSLEEIESWNPSAGVAMVTLAPERPGALDMVRALADRGVLVAAGHSEASYEEAMRGFDAGIRYVTHLFNAMPSIHHRAPGLPVAALEHRRVTVGLIPDGIHVRPELIRLVWSLKGRNRVNLVTDAMSAAGMAPGRYRMGDFDVEVDGSSARLPDGTLAGSVLGMDQALRNTLTFLGASITEVLPSVTSEPCDLLDLDGGALAPGCRADVVFFDEDLEVQATVVGGRVAWARSGQGAIS